ncbi:MAG: SMP-30/gluconolactonase/LRE family protein, partial [Anaerolineae bacterium]|nr:SMP-30/gluconolactonase/LRE family protein [Anaerolineae bacterium]
YLTVYAGTGHPGAINGPRLEATFDGPFSLAMDVQGNLFILERASGRIHIIDRGGFVYTWIGTPGEGRTWPRDRTSPFFHPTGLAVDAEEKVYISDARHRIVLIRPNGSFSLLAGGKQGFQDGPALSAAFRTPWDLVLSPQGQLYISDARNHAIRSLLPSGQVTTLAGTGQPGYRDGPAHTAQFNHPNGLCLGPDGRLYIADGGALSSENVQGNAAVRVLTPEGQVETLAGSDEPGYIDGQKEKARFQHGLVGLTMDDQGNLYVADTNNHAIRVITPEGQVLTVAGTGEYGLREGPGNQAQLGLPTDVLWDGKEGLFVADYGKHVILYIRLSR